MAIKLVCVCVVKYNKSETFNTPNLNTVNNTLVIIPYSQDTM